MSEHAAMQGDSGSRGWDSGLVGVLAAIVLATGLAGAAVVAAIALVRDSADDERASPQPPAPPVAAQAPERRDPIAAPSELRVGPDTPLERGQLVHVRRRGDWYRAEVTGLNADGTIAVHYLGWPKRDDQAEVARSRVRIVEPRN